jgi:hypothetical protein
MFNIKVSMKIPTAKVYGNPIGSLDNNTAEWANKASTQICTDEYT